jgi:hypothetical protein
VSLSLSLSFEEGGAIKEGPGLKQSKAGRGEGYGKEIEVNEVLLLRKTIRTYLTDTLRYCRQGLNGKREYASRSCACLEVKLHIPCFVINRLTYIYTDSFYYMLEIDK